MAEDTRSHAQKVLDALEATIEGRASRSDLEYEISRGGVLTRVQSLSHSELLDLYKFYSDNVTQENLVANNKSTKIRTRFV
jgi:hypothetical protein